MEAMRASYRFTNNFDLDCKGRDVGVSVQHADVIAVDDLCCVGGCVLWRSSGVRHNASSLSSAVSCVLFCLTSRSLFFRSRLSSERKLF
jgi:hypothetical protein